MSTFTYRNPSAAAVGISALTLVAGCSASGGNSAGTYGGARATAGAGTDAVRSSGTVGARDGSSAGSPATLSGDAEVGTRVIATEREYAITLSRTAFPAGRYTFTVRNVGRLSHNLTIEGPGVDTVASPITPGGGTSSVSVTFTKGNYELWCSVDSHKDKGMDMNITAP
ncbi:MAG TPA: hypothetical protein VHO01_07535 [Jatrophihabitans sp.]|nr:hypothetical protein [Jatrophihabitans sp.]